MPRKKKTAPFVAEAPLGCTEATQRADAAPTRLERTPAPLPALPELPPGEVLVAMQFSWSDDDSFTVLCPALLEAIAPLADALRTPAHGSRAYGTQEWEALFMEYHQDLHSNDCWEPVRDFTQGAAWLFENRFTLDEHPRCIYTGILAVLCSGGDVSLHGDMPLRVDRDRELSWCTERDLARYGSGDGTEMPALIGWATTSQSMLDMLTEGVCDLAPEICESRSNPSTDVYEIDGSDMSTLKWLDGHYEEVANSISNAQATIAGLGCAEHTVESRLRWHLAKLEDSDRLEAALGIHRSGESGDSIAMNLPGVGGGSSAMMGGGGCGLGWTFTVARITYRDALISTGPGYDYRDAIIATATDLQNLDTIRFCTRLAVEAPSEQPAKVEQALDALKSAMAEMPGVWADGLWLEAFPADAAADSIVRRVAELILAAAKDGKATAHDLREARRRLRAADRGAAPRRGAAS